MTKDQQFEYNSLPLSQAYEQQHQQAIYQSGYPGFQNTEQPAYNYQQQPYDQQEGYAYYPYQQTLFPTSPSGDARLAGVFCYVGGWFSGLMFTLLTRKNHFIRFHAFQSLLFFGGLTIIDILLVRTLDKDWLLAYLAPFSYLEPFFILFFLLLNVIGFICWIAVMVQAGRGEYFKLPIAGDIVERILGSRPTLK